MTETDVCIRIIGKKFYFDQHSQRPITVETAAHCQNLAGVIVNGIWFLDYGRAVQIANL